MKHLKAVVFDWAGTIVDFGSRAPMGAFVQVFADFGVTISIAEARGPMGMAKRDHISALIYAPEIAARWVAAHGASPTEADIDRIYDVFVPLNARVVTDFADMIPGALDVVTILRGMGLKIGSTTGYTREIMEQLIPVAAAAGYSPDNLVCAGDLAQGRPSPLMMYRCFADLGVFPPHAVVKVDDTEPGIAEGLAAGCWTVGVAVSGNALGLSRSEVEALPAEDFADRRVRAHASLKASGAHVVIDSVADLLPVVMDFDRQLADGRTPG